MPVFNPSSSNVLTTASVIELTDGVAFPLHASARAAFEAWLCLPVAVRPSKPALPGLVVVAPDGPLGALAVVSGFGAYLHAKMSASDVTAILLPLSAAESARAAEGEVAPLLAALASARRKPPRRRAAPSLLEIALREVGQG